MIMRGVALSICIAVLAFLSVTYGQSRSSSDLLPVVQDGKWGYIDNTGKVVIKPQYGLGGDFSEGLAPVLTREGRAYIDATGKIAIGPTREIVEARGFSEGLASVKASNSKSGYIDRTGRFIIKPQFEEAYEFSNGLARVQDGGKYGYIDKTGNVVIDLMFDDAQDFKQGLARVTLGARSGYINETGKYVWKPSK